MLKISLKKHYRIRERKPKKSHSKKEVNELVIRTQ
jgi:hypothetical protein